jgi:hypothetical protein
MRDANHVDDCDMPIGEQLEELWGWSSGSLENGEHTDDPFMIPYIDEGKEDDADMIIHLLNKLFCV